MASSIIPMKTIELTVEGELIRIRVDEPTYQLAVEENDPETIQDVYNRYLESRREERDSLPPFDYDVPSSPPWTGSRAGPSPQFESTRVDESLDAEVAAACATSLSEPIGGVTRWAHAAILLLVSLYADFKEKFASNVHKNKDLWKEIASRLQAKGHAVSGESCDKKFRMLRYRHKHITDSNSKTGRANTRWEYFDLMEELLAGDPAVKPVRVVSSTVATDKDNFRVSVTGRPPLPPRQQPAPARPLASSSPVESSTPSPPASPDRQVVAVAAPTPVVRRRKRSNSQEAPEYMKVFIADQTRVNELLLAQGDRKNSLLERMVLCMENNRP